MELRFVEGNFEHGKFKLQYREGQDGTASMQTWKDVPCVKEEPKKWCEHINFRHRTGGSFEAHWILEPLGAKHQELCLCDAAKFCPICGAKKP